MLVLQYDIDEYNLGNVQDVMENINNTTGQPIIALPSLLHLSKMNLEELKEIRNILNFYIRNYEDINN